MDVGTGQNMVVALGRGRQVPVRAPFRSTSEAATRRWGEELGSRLPPGRVVGLTGGLGAGKTVLAGALLRGAGMGPDVRVTSPTFTLMNRYPGDRDWVHVDLYRLESVADAHEAGLMDVLLGASDGLVVVEWFERFPDLWPPDHLRLAIEVAGPRTRVLTVPEQGGRT